MSDFGSISSGGLGGVSGAYSVTTNGNSVKQEQTTSEEVSRGEDSVQFSASAMRKSQEEQPVRQDKVDSVKAEIAAGDYINDERLDGAIDNLMKDLFA